MNIAIALNEPFFRYGYIRLTSVFGNNRDEKHTAWKKIEHDNAWGGLIYEL